MEDITYIIKQESQVANAQSKQVVFDGDFDEVVFWKRLLKIARDEDVHRKVGSTKSDWGFAPILYYTLFILNQKNNYDYFS
jgi:hypothetical protein